MCRCLYRCHYLLAQEVLFCDPLVALLVEGAASSFRSRRRWLLVVLVALTAPGPAAEVEVLA